MRLVCISDTHGDHDAVVLPAGDVLIHAGDVSAHGTEADIQKFIDWFASCDFEHRIFVAGNHDKFAETDPQRIQGMADAAGVTWLNDTGCEVNGVCFWGSPITPRFWDWSFMRDPGADIEQHWNLIPASTDVLITHGPPWGILDVVERSATTSEHTGCPSLLDRVKSVSPRLHLFGHIHEGYGTVRQHGVDYHNISTMDETYRIHNDPLVIDIGGEE